MYRDLNTIVKDLKRASELIINFTYPKSSTIEEANYDFMRSAKACIDGFLLNIYYTKSDYESHFFETVQIVGEYSPFIPFHVVFKIGKAFLGEENLGLTEFFQKNRKVYCWNMITTKDGQQMSSELLRGQKCNFEGCKYTLIDS